MSFPTSGTKHRTGYFGTFPTFFCYNDAMDVATRRGGVFLTPLPFAKKACEELEKLIGNDSGVPAQCWSGDYRLWDMAAGTGHLELFLPKEALKYCYLSTLEQKDVQHLQTEFPEATVFQYDYLNDDFPSSGNTVVGSLLPPAVCRLPPALQNDLANPKIKWIILVNPPYATAQEAGLKGTSKEGVADTNIRKQMHADGLGEVSRELYVQFLYRIMKDFKERETILGLFAPLKYLISANYQKFRDSIFHAQFRSGFIFSSEHFGGTSKSSHFPVSFILWDIKREPATMSPNLPTLHLDTLDSTAQKIGEKTIRLAHRDEFLSRWIKRPRGTKIFPPFGSALTIKPDNTDTRNRIADGFLASLMCPGNELQNQQQTAFLSGPQASAGALSVTPENFEQAVVVFAARRIPKNSWINHVDQLMRPSRELSPPFIADCAVWSLFDSKNQTVSLKDVVYQGQVYQIVNHFFPFPVNEFFTRGREGTEVGEQEGFFSVPPCLCVKNSFVADWLARQSLSAEARAVLESAREVYRLYFAHFPVPHDAGWYQIHKALREAQLGADLLAELKHRHDLLKEKILPQLCDYGIVSGFRL